MHGIQNKAGRQLKKKRKKKKGREDKRASEKPTEDDLKKKKPASHRLCGAEIPALSFLAGEQAESHNG